MWKKQCLASSGAYLRQKKVVKPMINLQLRMEYIYTYIYNYRIIYKTYINIVTMLFIWVRLDMVSWCLLYHDMSLDCQSDCQSQDLVGAFWKQGWMKQILQISNTNTGVRPANTYQIYANIQTIHMGIREIFPSWKLRSPPSLFNVRDDWRQVWTAPLDMTHDMFTRGNWFFDQKKILKTPIES